VKPQYVFPQFWRLPQVLEIIPEGKSSFLQKVADDIAPKPVKLGVRAVAWSAQEIIQYAEWLLARRDGTVAHDSTWRSLGDVAADVVEKAKP
jgi:predicted DNA-binding transcriptional regulator AlpA